LADPIRDYRLVVTFVIVFQPELRRVLMQLGQTKLVRALVRSRTPSTLDEVVKAATVLAQKRYGGLIVLQGSTGIRASSRRGFPSAPTSAPS